MASPIIEVPCSDVICEFPLREMLAFHKAKGAEATLLVTKVHMALLLDPFPPYQRSNAQQKGPAILVGSIFDSISENQLAPDELNALDSELSCD